MITQLCGGVSQGGFCRLTRPSGPCSGYDQMVLTLTPYLKRHLSRPLKKAKLEVTRNMRGRCWLAVVPCATVVVTGNMPGPAVTASLCHGAKAPPFMRDAELDDISNSPLDYTRCSLASSTCAFSSFKTGVTRIVPGGDTGCLFGDEYSFDVYKRGTSISQVAIYFEGGGACWNELSTVADLCTTTVSLPSRHGIFDDRSLNPVHDFVLVRVSYCSGDVHFGHINRSYGATQRGIQNTKAVLRWLESQQDAGEISSPLETLLITGSSAGSLGAQLWSTNITDYLAATNVVLLFDSFVGVFPPHLQSKEIRNFGACPFLPTQNLRDTCNQDAVLFPDIMQVQLLELESYARAAFIQSKADIVQRAYYDAIILLDAGCNSSAESNFIATSQFYAESQIILEQYHATDRDAGDIVAFFVDSEHHVYLDSAYLYTTSVHSMIGNHMLGNSSSHPGLADWVREYLNNSIDANATCEQCLGHLDAVSSDSYPAALTYCDQALASRCALT